MKPFVYVSLIIAVFVLLVHRLPAVFAQPSHIVLEKIAKVEVIVVEDASFCGGSVSLVNPSQLQILSYPPGIGPARRTLGPFVTGTELVFSLVPNPPCSDAALLSTDLNGVVVVRVREDLWGVGWMLDEGNVIMFLRLLEAELPTKRPVIFVHGLGGRPEDWTTGGKRIYFDTLKSDPNNYPEEFLHAYEYSDADGNPETYDYQGDVTLISQGLKEDVDRLADMYYLGCQEDCVDIVGFSLGGIVARQYLNTHKDNHKVRKLITIGTPHKGSYVLTPDSWLERVPVIGVYLRRAFNEFLNLFLAIPGRENSQPVDLNSTAAQQIIPGSLYLDGLNNINFIPIDPGYAALYGSIDAELSQRIFFFEFRKKFSIGDGLILEDSATGIPIGSLETFGVSDAEIYDVRIKVVDFPSGGYEYILDVPSIEDYRVWHGRLIIHPIIVEKVVKLVSN